ncbi:MAG: LuxR family transcriptional regulator, quorum-sensing system regulator BjaR1 [Methylobacteriaceae bacterium]|nr:LuxR family transcriptional regulator, quorum-sensing system regulator BjaR1 [Methylobacteriaceae bacterium]
MGVRMLVAESRFWKAALEFTERCNALTSVKTISEALSNAVIPLGFEHFAVTRGLFRRDGFSKAALATDWPAGWYDRYVAGGFYAFDPVVRRNRKSANPFKWTDVLPECRNDARASSVMHIAATEFRLCEGVCIPIHNLHGVEGAVSLGGEHVEVNAESLSFIHLISVFAATQMARVTSSLQQNLTMALSHREREVMCWAASGKTAAETASRMNLAVSTVDKQIASAMRKLRSATKTQAVAVALAEQYIAV